MDQTNQNLHLTWISYGCGTWTLKLKLHWQLSLAVCTKADRCSYRTQILYILFQTYKSTHTMKHNANSPYKWQSIVLGYSGALCCNVFEQASLLSCCSSAVYSLSCVMWQHFWIIWPWELNQKGKKLTAAAKLRWQGRRAITMSLSLHGLHKKFHRCQSCTNRHCPPETFSL